MAGPGKPTVVFIPWFKLLHFNYENRQLSSLLKLSTHPLISHLSLSKPLCMDWPMEFSMRSTYLMTCGAKVSRICWWNFPFLRLSVIQHPWIAAICISYCSHHQSGGSHWGSGRAGRCPMCRGAGARGWCSCPPRTGTRRARCAPPGGHWTTRTPKGETKSFLKH